MIKSQKCNYLKPRNCAKWIGILFLTSVLTVLFFQPVSAGNPGDYAVVHADPDVETIFKSNQMPLDYNYYYTGRSGLPYAVIGIDPKYTLSNVRFWNKIETRDQINYKIDHLISIGVAAGVTYGRILDSEGRQVGLWASEYHNTIIQFGSDNRLIVYTPYSPNDRL